MILTENFTEFSTAASVMMLPERQFYSSSSADLTASGMSFLIFFSLFIFLIFENNDLFWN